LANDADISVKLASVHLKELRIAQMLETRCDGNMCLIGSRRTWSAVADIAHPDWRGSAIGIYRFWRDLGYGVGALILGLSAAASGSLEWTFWLVAGAMRVSGLLMALH
jgi:hypothetical protein